MKSYAIFAGVLAGLLFTNSAVAQVYRSDSGLGGALILPYWTVAAGNDTLIGVSNDAFWPTAVKIRVLDEDGELLEHFNLYLNARSQWGAALAQINGQTLLLPSEVGCLLPAPSASHNGRPALPLDALRGTVEIIEMGEGSPGSDLLDNIWTWADCDALAQAFDSGVWSEDSNVDMDPPTQLIGAQATLINVAAGGMNTVPATAIGNFSDIAQHTAPGTEFPDLLHAVDSGAENGGVRSVVCIRGSCRSDDWERPIDALAAVLTVSSKTVGYSVDPGLAAEFEWVIHAPLKRYQDELSNSACIRLNYSSGEPRAWNTCVIPICFCAHPLLPGISALQSLSFNAFLDGALVGDEVESSILGHPARVKEVLAIGALADDDPNFFGGTANMLLSRRGLTGNDGSRFQGEPLISFAIQQFSNGTLTDDQGQNVLSNYRRTELPRQVLWLQPPN